MNYTIVLPVQYYTTQYACFMLIFFLMELYIILQHIAIKLPYIL